MQSLLKEFQGHKVKHERTIHKSNGKTATASVPLPRAKKSLAVFDPFGASIMATKQKLDCGITVYFGQCLEEVERSPSCQVEEKKLPRYARPGIDKILKLPGVVLDFDSGRLARIGFKYLYQFVNAPEPYPEKWKNFDAVGGKKIHGEIFRDEFVEYLKDWEERANSLGMKKAVGDLSASQYRVSFDRDEFSDMIHISMGPSRRTAKGGIWCDGWCLFFQMDSKYVTAREKAGLLSSLSAFRDEFNTNARKRG